MLEVLLRPFARSVLTTCHSTALPAASCLARIRTSRPSPAARAPYFDALLASDMTSFALLCAELSLTAPKWDAGPLPKVGVNGHQPLRMPTRAFVSDRKLLPALPLDFSLVAVKNRSAAERPKIDSDGRRSTLSSQFLHRSRPRASWTSCRAGLSIRSCPTPSPFPFSDPRAHTTSPLLSSLPTLR